jgi:hypothetical protein
VTGVSTVNDTPVVTRISDHHRPLDFSSTVTHAFLDPVNLARDGSGVLFTRVLCAFEIIYGDTHSVTFLYVE